MPKFSVTITASKEFTFEVEAEDEDQAEKLAGEKLPKEFAIEDINVEEVEEDE
jgi:hypothetical protein